MRNLSSLACPVRRATYPLARPLAALGLLLATAGAAQAQTTTNFTYAAPGSVQSYTVPAGITRLNVVATGAAGGGNRGTFDGGLGAVVQATVTVVPGEVLTVVVGGQGGQGNNGSNRIGGAGGYNGGGTGAATGGGGGGATDLRRAVASGRTSDYLASRNALLVAGGGGGSDLSPATGGNAGMPNGGNGVSGQGGPAGQGATTTALGGGNPGSNGLGGNGNPNNFNAAGGGGYYGGGGGNGGVNGGGVNGGGGGSSYVLPTGSSNVSYSLAGSRTDGALAITTVPAPTNNALAFDGTDDYVSLGSPAALSNLGPGGYTLEAWVYYDGRSGTSSIIRKTGDYNLYINNGTLRAEVWPQGGGNASWRVAGGSTTLVANRWYHVAATWTPTTNTLAFYVNGVVDPLGGSGTGSSINSEGLALGASTIYGSYLGGRLDEVRIYNAPLTATQVQADMYSTSSALPGSQKYYANFDQGTAGGTNAGLTSLTDQSGNGSTGTLTDFALTGTGSNWVRSFPTITGIAPASGTIGSSVTLTGTNLTDATGFAFNGTAVSPFPTPGGDLAATVTVPSGATTGPVSVASATLTRYNGPTFTVIYPDLVVTTPTTIPAGIYNTISVRSGGIATLAGPAMVMGGVEVQDGGTLNTNCQVLNGGGFFNLLAGGTLGICDAAGITTSGATGAVQLTGGRFFSINASYIYNGTAAQRTGNALPAQVRNLRTTNANTLTLSQATSITQVLTLASTGNLATGGQALTLLSSAAGTALLVNSNIGVVTGAVTIQRYIDPSLNPSTTANPGGKGYRHYSSPVANTTVADLTTTNFAPVLTQSYNTSATPGTTTPFPNVFGYDQSRLTTASNSNYSAFDKGFVVPAAGSVLVPGRGYAVNIAGTELVDFVGTPNNGNLTVNLSRNSDATAAAAGWALVGNPYPAPLDYAQLQFLDLLGVDRAMYVVQSTGQYAGQYRSYVNGNSANDTRLTAEASLIAAGQGFFVRVSSGQTSGTITFRNPQRVTSYDRQSAFQRTTADTRPSVHLTLAGAGLADGFVAYAEAGATPDFDSQYDAAKLPNPTGLNLSSTTATDNLAIDGRAAFTAATTLALNVGVPAAGTYTLSAASLANLPAGLTATLRDAATGQATKLAAGTAYSFSVTEAEATALVTGRFTLQFSSATALATAASLSATEVTVYPNPAQGRFTVLVPAVASASAVQAELLNTLGQVVRRQSAALPAAGATLSVETAGLATGVYTLRLQAGSSTIAKRVVLH